MRSWRNWYTRTAQTRMPARVREFESLQAHDGALAQWLQQRPAKAYTGGPVPEPGSTAASRARVRNPGPSALGVASRLADGTCPENRRAARAALRVQVPPLRSWIRNPTGDGTGFESRRASRPCRSDSCRIRPDLV